MSILSIADSSNFAFLSYSAFPFGVFILTSYSDYSSGSVKRIYKSIAVFFLELELGAGLFETPAELLLGGVGMATWEEAVAN